MTLKESAEKATDAAAVVKAGAALTAEHAYNCSSAVSAVRGWLTASTSPGQPRLTDTDIVFLIRRDFTKDAKACLDRPELGLPP